MKFVLASYGSRGDVEPFAAVGQELLRRGHDVCIAAPPKWVGFVESLGLAAVALGSDPQALRAEDVTMPQNPITAMGEVVQQVAQAWSEWGTTLTTLAHGADLLLTGNGEQGLAANVAEYYDIPHAALHFFPAGDTRPGGWIGQVTQDAENAQRRALGLSETTAPSTPLEIQAYDELCFPGLTAQWAEQAGRRPFVGALTLEAPTEADAEVLSWVAAGTPPIYVGFGSGAQVADPVVTVAVIGAACAQLDERVLICSGPSDFTHVPQYDHVKVVGAVNHGAVFPACRAVVHHGGAGTTAAGMRAGIPTLILWLGVDDQPIWAAALQRLKIGAGRPFWTSTGDSLVADLRAILTPECITRAREVATQMTKPAESVARAADLLEDTARLGRFG